MIKLPHSKITYILKSSLLEKSSITEHLTSFRKLLLDSFEFSECMFLCCLERSWYVFNDEEVFTLSSNASQDFDNYYKQEIEISSKVSLYLVVDQLSFNKSFPFKNEQFHFQLFQLRALILQFI